MISGKKQQLALRAAGNAKAQIMESGMPFYGQLCASIYVLRSYASDAGGNELHDKVRVLCDEIYKQIHESVGDGAEVTLTTPERQAYALRWEYGQ